MGWGSQGKQRTKQKMSKALAVALCAARATMRRQQGQHQQRPRARGSHKHNCRSNKTQPSTIGTHRLKMASRALGTSSAVSTAPAAARVAPAPAWERLSSPLLPAAFLAGAGASGACFSASSAASSAASCCASRLEAVLSATGATVLASSFW